jgi:hypothetical protein
MEDFHGMTGHQVYHHRPSRQIEAPEAFSNFATLVTLFCATPPHWRLNTPLFPYFRALRFGTTARLPLSSGFVVISPPSGPSAPSVGRSPCRESPCRIPQGRCDRGSWQLEPCRFPRAARATRNFNSTFNPTLHPLAPFPSSRPLALSEWNACKGQRVTQVRAAEDIKVHSLCTLAAAPQSMVHGGGRLLSAFPQVK